MCPAQAWPLPLTLIRTKMAQIFLECLSEKLLVVCCGLPTAFRVASGREGWVLCRSDHSGIIGGNQRLEISGKAY